MVSGQAPVRYTSAKPLLLASPTEGQSGTRLRKSANKYELKMSISPIRGNNTCSVFKNGELVLMVDGDRLSVFKPEEVEMISFPDNPDCRIVRAGNWAFTGSAALTKEQRKRIPRGCKIISTI